MIFGILFCVVVMVVPSVCVFAKANKDVVMDRTIYVGTKQNWGVINARSLRDLPRGTAVYYLFFI